MPETKSPSEQFKLVAEEEAPLQERKKQLENELAQNQREQDEIEAKIAAVEKACQRAIELAGHNFPIEMSLAEIIEKIKSDPTRGGARTTKEFSRYLERIFSQAIADEWELPEDWCGQLAELKNRRGKIEQELKELKIQEEISKREPYLPGGINVQPSGKSIN